MNAYKREDQPSPSLIELHPHNTSELPLHNGKVPKNKMTLTLELEICLEPQKQNQSEVALSALP